MKKQHQQKEATKLSINHQSFQNLSQGRPQPFGGNTEVFNANQDIVHLQDMVEEEILMAHTQLEQLKAEKIVFKGVHRRMQLLQKLTLGKQKTIQLLKESVLSAKNNIYSRHNQKSAQIACSRHSTDFREAKKFDRISKHFQIDRNDLAKQFELFKKTQENYNATKAKLDKFLDGLVPSVKQTLVGYEEFKSRGRYRRVPVSADQSNIRLLESRSLPELYEMRANLQGILQRNRKCFKKDFWRLQSSLEFVKGECSQLDLEIEAKLKVVKESEQNMY